MPGVQLLKQQSCVRSFPSRVWIYRPRLRKKFGWNFLPILLAVTFSSYFGFDRKKRFLSTEHSSSQFLPIIAKLQTHSLGSFCNIFHATFLFEASASFFDWSAFSNGSERSKKCEKTKDSKVLPRECKTICFLPTVQYKKPLLSVNSTYLCLLIVDNTNKNWFFCAFLMESLASMFTQRRRNTHVRRDIYKYCSLGLL